MTFIPWTYCTHGFTVDAMRDLRRPFGRAVRRARESRGWTQEKLSAAAGLDRTYISGLERGVRNPSLVTQGRIAEALGLPLHHLVEQAEAQA